jgi:hypothetical protein
MNNAMFHYQHMSQGQSSCIGERNTQIFADICFKKFQSDARQYSSGVG